MIKEEVDKEKEEHVDKKSEIEFDSAK